MIENIQKTAITSFQILEKSKKKIKVISALDFIMQVQPNWSLYLCYTAIRCGILTRRYVPGSLEERVQIWKEAQLYSSIKVTGLIVSQAALYTLGYSTLPTILLILCWGGVLASFSFFASKKANEG